MCKENHKLSIFEKKLFEKYEIISQSIGLEGFIISVCNYTMGS